jgi:hypothetical protein
MGGEIGQSPIKNEMPKKHRTGYKDRFFSTEAVRDLFRKVAEAPLRVALKAIGAYESLRGDWRRRQIADVFGVWRAARHWWLREPCKALKESRQCWHDDPDPEHVDAGNHRNWDQCQIYTGCGPVWSLLVTAYKARPYKAFIEVLRALERVHPQELSAPEARALSLEDFHRVVEAIAAVGPQTGVVKWRLREIAVTHGEPNTAQRLHESIGLFDGVLGEAKSFPRPTQAACGRLLTANRALMGQSRIENWRRIQREAVAVLCRSVEMGTSGLARWCRKHFPKANLLELNAVELRARRALSKECARR